MAEPSGELPPLPPTKLPAEPPVEHFAEPLAEPAAQPAAANQVIASFWCFLFGLPACTRFVFFSNVLVLVFFV